MQSSPEIVLTGAVQFDLDRIATAVFKINYGGLSNCPKMTEEDLRVLSTVVMNPNYTIAHPDFPLLDEPLLARLQAVASNIWWRSPLFTYEQIWSGAKAWVCKKRQQSIILELSRSSSPRSRIRWPREESQNWDCDWPLLHFVTLVENGCRYICAVLRRDESRDVGGALNINAFIDKYMESVLGAFSSLPDSSFSRLFAAFIEFTPVADSLEGDSLEGGGDSGEDAAEDGVHPVWRREAQLLPAIVDSLVGLAQVPLLNWKRYPDPTLDTTSFPPISNPTAATLPHIVVKELDVSFIESGPFKITSTPFIDEHLTFDPETETISIYNDYASLHAARATFLNNRFLGIRSQSRVLDGMTDTLAERWVSMRLHSKFI